MSEATSFCEAFDELVNEKLETGDEYHARMKEKNKAPINPFPASKSSKPKPQSRKSAPKDTRTDAEKMADATDERAGSFYRRFGKREILL